MGNGVRIPTNLRTLMILEVLGKSDKPMTPTEINAHIGLPKQTIHRLCNTLEAEGFIIQEIKGKRLQASPRLKNLASGILFNARSQSSVRQVLLEVARNVGETVNLAIPKDDGMEYFDRVETDWPFRIQLPVGSHVPFHCTASGKTFIASMKPSLRKAFVKGLTLHPLTPNTFDNSDDFLKEVNQISKQGYSVDNEEFMQGMIAVAVPVTDEFNRYCASIAFHAPTQRLSMKEALERRDYLISAAKKMGPAFFN